MFLQGSFWHPCLIAFASASRSAVSISSSFPSAHFISDAKAKMLCTTALILFTSAFRLISMRTDNLSLSNSTLSIGIRAAASQPLGLKLIVAGFAALEQRHDRMKAKLKFHRWITTGCGVYAVQLADETPDSARALVSLLNSRSTSRHASQISATCPITESRISADALACPSMIFARITE